MRPNKLNNDEKLKNLLQKIETHKFSNLIVEELFEMFDSAEVRLKDSRKS